MIPCRPSSSNIWSKCFGYPRMVAALPSGWATSAPDPAREGTCAAWVAEMVLTGEAQCCAEMVGEQHTSGWVVDEDMVGFIQDYVDLLRERYGERATAEQHVRLSDFIAGTPDAYAIIDDHLYVDDLKYGHGIVEPWDNTQVMIYAGAIARNSSVKINHVTIGIYQPRAYHPLGHHRTWQPSIEELSQRLAELIHASEQAQNPEALCTPGEHCRYCDAAHRCAAVAFENYRAVSFMRNDYQREMTDEEISTELKFIELAENMLSGRKNAVKADAKARIKAGRVIPDWSLESGKGHRKWSRDAATVHAMTGIDPSSDKMVTPAELIRRGADKKMVAALVETPDTAPKLKRYSSRVVAKNFEDMK